MKKRGWRHLDIILVSGDSYIDTPFDGISVIGRFLEKHGFRVGIIAQPDVATNQDITRLGEPRLFWGVSGGCVDSMVANYTATGKRRRDDDFTPGGLNNRRPDRASIAYANLIRKNYKETAPIVLGGIEASLRRIAHYDFWSNKVRRSILFDAKADFLIYGMAEKSVLELATCLREHKDPTGIRGLCFISKTCPEACLELPSFEEAAISKTAFLNMFQSFYQNNEPQTAIRLAQKQDTRYLVQNPPVHPLEQSELDEIYGLPFTREQHPFYEAQGSVKALDTIRFSITSHRGCYGECNFCAIAVHQGRQVNWRSQDSILEEAGRLADHSRFKGTISDVGGPTANMYGFECKKKIKKGSCPDKRCLYPSVCIQMPVDHGPQRELLGKLREMDSIKKVVVASGLRYDMIMADKKHGDSFICDLVEHHVSGQLKLAPEHSETHVLDIMGKPDTRSLKEFRRRFMELNRLLGKKQFLTYYLIAAHPGCSEQDMKDLKEFALEELRLLPEQVQIFTPTPSTWSTCMYWTETNPFSGKPCFVEKDPNRKERQKAVLSTTHQNPDSNLGLRKKQKARRSGPSE